MFKKTGSNGSGQAASDLAIPGADRAETALKSARPAPSPAPREERSRLIVGSNIKLRGAEITDCDTLVVEGRVEASMDSRVIQIADGGVFKGTVSVDRAEIRGTFEGEMTVRDRLIVQATGRVSGKVRYGRMAVEEGGEIIGDVAALPTNERKSDATAALSEAAESASDPAPSGAEPDSVLPVRPKREAFAHPARTNPPNGAHAERRE
jgi:cytoskeletal protein CcmA (bactofilin family)